MTALGVFRAAKRAVLVVGLAAAGCSAPAYDEETDRLISALQSDVDGEIVMLISLDREVARLSARTDDLSRKALAEAKANATYEANIKFYNKIDTELNSIRLRIASAPSKAGQSIGHSLDELDQNLLSPKGSLRSEHEMRGTLPEVYLRIERGALNQQFQALLAYEQVLKTGAPTLQK